MRENEPLNPRIRNKIDITHNFFTGFFWFDCFVRWYFVSYALQ